MANKIPAEQVFFCVLIALLVVAAVTGVPHLEQPGLVESIVLILLWLSGQR